MIEILNIATLSPALITYKQDSEIKSTIVYIDYLSQQIVQTEDIESEDLRKQIFNFIAKSKKPIILPNIPKSNLDSVEKFTGY